MVIFKIKFVVVVVFEYDFDNWLEEVEEKVIVVVVFEVKYIIVEKCFIGCFGDGMIIEVLFIFSFDFIDQLQVDYFILIDQFKVIFIEIGGEVIFVDFGKWDMVEGVIFVEKYFWVLQCVQQVVFLE